MEVPKNLASAYDKALDLLSRAPQTTFMIRTKLADRDFIPEDIDKTVILLTNAGLLDDDDFARNYAEMMVNRKMYGPARIKAKFYEKGLRGTEFDDIIFDITEEAGGEESIAASYIQKNRISFNRIRNTPQKMQRKLYQHGFSYDTIRISIENIDSILV
jgi:regulatory protein